MLNRGALFRAVLAMLIAISMVLVVSYASAEDTTGKPKLFTSGEYRYTVNEDGTASIYAYGGSESELTVPSALDGHPVTDISEGAFIFDLRLTSVAIPDSVTSIDGGAFPIGQLLKTITVSNDNPTYASVNGVLFDKTANALLVYPCAKAGASYEIPSGTAAIGDAAFNHCQRLTSIAIPDSVLTIGADAFAGCQSLAPITIPDGVTSISDYAFANCRSLTYIAVPDSVTSIGDAVFSGCLKLGEIAVSEDNPIYESIDCVLFTKLTKILRCSPPARSAKDYEIPRGTTAIGNFAFSGNGNLTSLIIPYGVESIGDFAFVECDKLVSITIPESVTSIGESAFKGCALAVHADPGSYAWKYFLERGYVRG